MLGGAESPCVAGGMHDGGVCMVRACMAGDMHGGGHAWQEGMHGGRVNGRGVHGRGVHGGGGTCVAEETATAADGTHATGMHSCFSCIYKVSRFSGVLVNAPRSCIQQLSLC